MVKINSFFQSLKTALSPIISKLGSKFDTNNVNEDTKLLEVVSRDELSELAKFGNSLKVVGELDVADGVKAITYTFPTQNFNHVSAVIPGKGFLGCSYYDIDAINADGSNCECVAIVEGVSRPEEMLNKTVIEASSTAQELGIIPHKTLGREALELMARAA